MKSAKIDTSGTAAAQKAIADAQNAATTLQKNFRADLGTQNLTQVVAGGGAEDALAASVAPKRRRTASTGLSSSLGIM